MAVTLTQVERAYFVRKLGGTQPPTKPLNQIKREYFVSLTGAASPQISMSELENRWLMKVLTTAGVVYNDSATTNDLWNAMPVAIGKTPSKYTTGNMITFYLNAP